MAFWSPGKFTLLGGAAGGGFGAGVGYLADKPDSGDQNPYGQAIQMPDFLKGYKDFANSTELSPYASALMAKQGQEQAMSADQLAQKTGADRAQAMSGLAQSGGLTSGARERIANADMGSSYGNLLRQGQLSRMDIAAKDLGTKQNAFLSLPEKEQAAWEAQQGLNLGQKQASMLWQQAQDQKKGLLAKLPGEIFGGLF